MLRRSLIALALILFSCAACLGQPTLRNAGFENASPLDGWDLHVYGAAPIIEADESVRHEGRRSIRISSDTPTDTAFGQEIQLSGGRIYRLSGWVRTRGLDPRDAPVFGTLQAQLPGGRGVIATGENHRGDSGWGRVSVLFQAPPAGLTRVSVFFVGFGKGTGTAWFDDLRLEEVNTGMSVAKITNTPLHGGRISPLQYGQFIEYLCNLVPGMWAEKLYDPGFEGLTPYKFTFIAQTDFREKPWYPSGAVNRAKVALDHEIKVNGATSQRIAIEPGAPCSAGISQDGIAVERGRGLKLRIWLRGAGVRGTVRFTLKHAGARLAHAELPVDGEWKPQSTTLTPSESTADATLSIHFDGPGTIWLDNASLMPTDTVGGWRRDVVDALTALRPGIIRFGGSALDDANLGEFDWRDSVGDPDHRKPLRAWGGLQQPGAGLEEIVQLCRAVKAEALICVRVERRTPKDAADEVEYFNGAIDTPMGAMRAKNGHPAPYRVRYWQVGNERSGSEYETRLPEFCRAMRAVDPTIKLLSSYPTPGVMKAAGDLLDYLCPHQYDVANLDSERRDLEAVRRLITEHAPSRNVKVAVTEWNTTGGDWGPRRAMLWTLENALACSRYQNLLHRESDLVEIANRSNLTNSFCSGIIQTDNHRLYTTPTYYAQQLYATLAGATPLKIDSELPANLSPDLSATLSEDGKALTLFAVNESTSEVARTLDLSAFVDLEDAEVWTLTDRDHAGSPDVTNSFDEPTRVSPVRSKLRTNGPHVTYRFPALSLTVIQWRVGAVGR